MQDNFFDSYTFDLTRNQMIDQLASMAGDCGAADPEKVKELISEAKVEGLKNAGTAVTQARMRESRVHDTTHALSL